jgi:hypothetical protein
MQSLHWQAFQIMALSIFAERSCNEHREGIERKPMAEEVGHVVQNIPAGHCGNNKNASRGWEASVQREGGTLKSPKEILA